jgi:hypothetical protein
MDQTHHVVDIAAYRARQRQPEEMQALVASGHSSALAEQIFLLRIKALLDELRASTEANLSRDAWVALLTAAMADAEKR